MRQLRLHGMKLWILRPITDDAKAMYRGQTRKIWSWDCAYGFVVRAEDERSAREFVARSRDRDDWENTTGDEGPEAWRDVTLTSCVELTGEGGPEIILRDFVAG